MHNSISGWFNLVMLLLAGISTVSYRYGRFTVQWFNSLRGRDWATASAVIDIVTVVKQTEQDRYGAPVIGYLATLTYFYRNPELQVGEFSRMFREEAEGRAWADSFKGRAVMVHVDPRDPTHSVLLKDEL